MSTICLPSFSLLLIWDKPDLSPVVRTHMKPHLRDLLLMIQPFKLTSVFVLKGCGDQLSRAPLSVARLEADVDAKQDDQAADCGNGKAHLRGSCLESISPNIHAQRDLKERMGFIFRQAVGWIGGGVVDDGHGL